MAKAEKYKMKVQGREIEVTVEDFDPNKKRPKISQREKDLHMLWLMRDPRGKRSNKIGM